ncbi:MAG: type IV secretory system conjugative DNA transfer family protein, partial [Candidatus Tectomicrobia bacterium]|nr:type IV secretory system conjugative DNA transfer family protein [Candidatus Tectomicrobia bacterium]
MRVSPGKEAGYLLVAVVASVAALVPLGDFGFVLDARLHYVAAGVGSLWVSARLGVVLMARARWSDWRRSPSWVVEAADLPLEERRGGRLPGVLARFRPAEDTGILLGRGFQWTPQHTQELETFMRDGARPLPTGAGERGGHPALHAVGRTQERPLVLPFSELVGHVLIGGTTRSGKTRLLEVIACEAIQAPGTVVVIDPKGDVELLLRAAAQARRIGREFRFFSPAFPHASKTFNPLSMCETTTELAARVQ